MSLELVFLALALALSVAACPPGHDRGLAIGPAGRQPSNQTLPQRAVRGACDRPLGLLTTSAAWPNRLLHLCGLSWEKDGPSPGTTTQIQPTKRKPVLHRSVKYYLTVDVDDGSVTPLLTTVGRSTGG